MTGSISRDGGPWRLRIIVLLLAGLLGSPVTARAASVQQDQAAAQCAEGLRLLEAGQADAALPLLERGIAGRAQATFARPDDLGNCAWALARLRGERGDQEGALAAYAVALASSRQSGNRADEGATLDAIGLVYSAQGQYAQALDYYQRALALTRVVDDGAGEGTVLGNIGMVYLDQGQYTQALDAFQQALDIQRAIGNRVGEGTILNNIGGVYLDQGQYTHALDAFQQALAIMQAIGNRASEGTFLNNIGEVYLAQGQYAQALDALQQALAIERAVGERVGEGTILNNPGQVYHHQGQYAQALDALQQGLALARAIGNRTGEGTILNNIGRVYLAQSQYAQALDAFQQALALARAMGDRAGEGTFLNNIGQVYYHQGQYAQALDYYQQALARVVDDGAGESTRLGNIGMVYLAQGQYAQALDALQQALALARAVGDGAGESTTLGNIGLVYLAQGQYTQALDAFQQALALARAIGNRVGEGTTLGNIGGVYEYQGQYAQALDYYQQGLALARAIGNRAGESAFLNNIGAVYERQGQPAQALDALQQALALARAVDDRAGEGTILNNIGAVYDRLGQPAQALDALQQALALARAIGNRAGESAFLNNIGAVYDRLGQHAQALDYYQRALDIRRAVGDRAGEGATLNNLGLVYRSQGQYAQALDYYQQALAIERAVGDRAGEGITLNNLGAVYYAQGKYAQALDYYQQALDILEIVRANTATEQGRAGFIAQYSAFYERAVMLAHQQGQDDLAFMLNERGRARAFLDTLATGTVRLSDQAEQTLLTDEQAAYAARLAAQDTLARARAADPPDTALLARLEQQLATAEQAHRAALAAIEQRGGQLAALVPRRHNGVLDRAAVQRLLAPQTTLVAYQVGTDQSLAFVITRDHFQVVSLPIGGAALYALVQALRDSPDGLTQPHTPQAIALYQTLIAPLKPFLTTPHLAIVPHTVLHYLPFAALSDGQHYLADQYILSVLPSASTLPFIQNNTGRPATPALVIGNPDGGLPFAGQEAQAVAQLYGVAPLLGAAATKASLRHDAGQAGIVHIAAHGHYDPAHPLASWLALAPGGEAAGQLSVEEVYGLDLHRADLVVLSACQTNLGEVSAGDEVVGLTRAFLFAGTPTVVASLWSVDDAATSLLMTRFYTHLRSGMGKAQALRRAQRDLRDYRDPAGQQPYAAPYYWAGFVLAGDPGALDQLPEWIEISIGGALALVMLGMTGLLLRIEQRSHRTLSSRALIPRQDRTIINAIDDGIRHSILWQVFFRSGGNKLNMAQRIGLLIALALLASSCGPAPSTEQGQSQPATDEPIHAPIALGNASSSSNMTPAPILPSPPEHRATTRTAPSEVVPPAARAMITPATLADLHLIHEVALPSTAEAAIAPNSRLLAVATRDTVVLFEIPSLRQMQTLTRSFPRFAEPVRLAFRPDGSALALRETVFGEGGGDSVTTWAITSASSSGDAGRANLQVDNQFTRAAFSPTGALAWQDPRTGQIVLQQGDGTMLTLTNKQDTPDLIAQWIDPEKNVPLQSPQVSALEFSTNGSLLAVGNQTGKIMLFQTADGARVGSLQATGVAPSTAIEGLAFSADSTLVAARLADRLIVWQLSTNKPVLERKLAMPRSEATPSHDVMTFSADNQLVITADLEGVTFYRLESGAVLRTLPLASQGLALSSDGQLLAIVHDGKVALWGIGSASR